MTAVAFWNVQRLGAGSDKGRVAAFERTLQYFWEAEALILCEVTGDRQLTGVQLIKMGSNALGYSMLPTQPTQSQFVTQNQSLGVGKFNELFGFPIWLKGGNTFDRQSKRPVYNVATYGGLEIYVYHANASSRASAVMTWAIGALCAAPGNFLLVGDFNCTPDDLNRDLKYALDQQTTGISMDGLKLDWGGPTYPSSDTLWTYDYAAARGIQIKVKTVRLPEPERFSDHLPIIVRF